jgi:hypothetical protein
MEELGVSHDRLAQALAALTTVNGRRMRRPKSGLLIINPRAQHVSGWAKGFAAASGRRLPSAEDWLLAIVYNDPMAGSILHGLGVSGAAIVDALRGRGVKVPDFDPEEHPPWRGHREVEVPRSEMKAVVTALQEKHQPGSEWEWGFNFRRDRPGMVQISSENGIDLEAIVAEVLADRTSRSA